MPRSTYIPTTLINNFRKIVKFQVVLSQIRKPKIARTENINKFINLKKIIKTSHDNFYLCIPFWQSQTIS